MKLIIAGSRTFTDYQLLCQIAGAGSPPHHPGHHRRRPGRGSARLPLGLEARVKHQLFRADWERFGKTAGVRRNHQMAQAGDMLIAFWDGQSPGTAHMLQCMGQLGKPVVVIRVDTTA